MCSMTAHALFIVLQVEWIHVLYAHNVYVHPNSPDLDYDTREWEENVSLS